MLKKIWISNTILSICIAAIIGVITYWFHSRQIESTHHSIVNATIYQITPEVSGKILALFVENNQEVKKGDLLFEIDPKPFKTAVEHTKSQLKEAEFYAKIQSTLINDAQSLIIQRQAELDNAKAAVQTLKEQMQHGVGSARELDALNLRVITSAAILKATKDKWEKIQIGEKNSGNINAKVNELQNSLNKAQLALNLTKVYANCDGIINDFYIHPGQIISANQPLFNLIENKKLWLEALFTETQIKRIKPGQKAIIHFESYPDHPFYGVIDSIAGIIIPAKQDPYQNEHNSIEVRIRMNDFSSDYPLRIGSTAKVDVKVNSTIPMP